MKSIIQSEKDGERECFICKIPEPYPLERHHCLAGSYRQKAEEYGLTIYLCPEHHKMAHETEIMMSYLRAKAQRIAMEYYGWTEEEFIKEIGRSFI